MPKIESWMLNSAREFRKLQEDIKTPRKYILALTYLQGLIASEYEKAQGSMLANSVAELQQVHVQTEKAHAPATSATHIVGMEPENVCRQMIRNYCAGGHPLTVEDCILLMMEFNRWLVSTNETCQKLVLDKINTELPKPIEVAEAAPTTPLVTDEHHAVDDGYCSCGVYCETGTKFEWHLSQVAGQGRKP